MGTLIYLLFLSFIIGIIVVIPVLLGIYVYRDSKRRGMNSVLWVLISLLAPSFIGFVIYLLIRGDYSDLKCPRCDADITQTYLVCPKCGTKLKMNCPNCFASVESGWKICPHCANPLPEEIAKATAPVRKKDRSLSGILTVMILIPTVIIIFTIVSFFAVAYAATGSINTTYLEKNQYLYDMSERENYSEIAEWFENCDETSGKAYALRYITERNDKKITQYLVFLPCAGENTKIFPEKNDGMFGESVEVKFADNPGASDNGYNLCTVSVHSDRGIPKLQVYYNGKKLQCEISEASGSLTLFEIISESESASRSTSPVIKETLEAVPAQSE